MQKIRRDFRLALILVLILFGITSVLNGRTNPGKIKNPFYGKNLTASWLLQRTKLAGDYLSDFQYSSGRYYYLVSPFSGEEIEAEGSKYSLVRHFGATLCLLQLYKVTNKSKYLTAAKNTIKYSLSFAKKLENKKNKIQFRTNKDKIAESGFCLIVLSWYYHVTNGDEDYIDETKGLAKYLLSKIDSSGKIHVNRKKNAKKWSWSQVCIGLMLYDKHCCNHRDTVIKNKVKGVLNYLLSQKVTDHWYPQALSFYCQEYGKVKKYYTFAKSWATKLLAKIYTKHNAPSTFYIGTVFNRFSSCMVAARSEGVLATYKLALLFNDRSFEKKLNIALNNAIYYLLQHQYTNEGYIYKRKEVDIEDAEIEGGWFASFTNPKIRIDYIRHSVSLILEIIMLEDDDNYDFDRI